MNSNISIIPKPQKIKVNNGMFALTSQTQIRLDSTADDISGVGDYLADMLHKGTGFALVAEAYTGNDLAQGNVIALSITGADKSLGAEGYLLRIESNKIIIKASEPVGLFYAAQTLRQLFIVEIEKPFVPGEVKNLSVPCVEIHDAPLYGWRGLLLDVSRYFFDKAFIFKYIDYMAMHKLNHLHLHLTDDHGWRLEIDKYPELTEIGAWRKQSTI